MSTACDAAPAQVSSAGREREGDRAAGGEEHAPAEPADAADRQREQRLELLIGLLGARRAHLRAREQADGEDEEDEDERRDSRRASGSSPRRSCAISSWTLLDMPAEETLVETIAEDEREHADAARPRDEAAPLAAQGLRGGRGEKPEARGALSRDGQHPGADVPAGADPAARIEQQRARRRPGAAAPAAGDPRTGASPRPNRAASPTAASRAAVEVSPTTRSSRESATTALPSSSATRRVGASWLASAPTPTKTGTTDAVASAR